MKYFYLAIIAVLLFICVSKSCRDHIPGPGKMIPDTLTTDNASHSVTINHIDSSVINRVARFRSDSLSMITAYNRLQSKYIKAMSIIPDTCKPQIEIIYREAIVLDSTDRATIARRDSTIDEQAQQIGLYKLITRNDSTRMAQLSDSLKAERKSRKKYWRGFKHGAIAGAILAESANVGVKFIK